MDNDFTIDPAYITALAAIVAPAITAIIHSVKEYKLAKLNHTIPARLKLCEEFTSTYKKCQYGPEKTGYMSDFYKSSMQLIAVCSHAAVRRNLFRLANQVLNSGASTKTDFLYERCIRLLAKEF